MRLQRSLSKFRPGQVGQVVNAGGHAAEHYKCAVIAGTVTDKRR
jgi:hypothetical protein